MILTGGGEDYALLQIGLILDLVTLGLAVVVTSIGIVAAKKSRGVAVRLTWNMLILAAVAMGIHEIKDILQWSGVIQYAGWMNVWELIVIGAIVVASNSLQRLK